MDTPVPRRAFSVDEFHRMAEAGVFGEDDRVELLAGEVIEMSPIGSRHASCVNRLSRSFHQHAGSSLIVRVQSPITLDEHSEPQPDLAVLNYRPDFYREAHPRPNEVRLVVEVADTSAEGDRGVKVPLYARAGIPETWVIDFTERTVDVYRRPSAGSYQEHHRVGPRDRLNSSQVAGLELSVDDIVS
jgi:Uma2 family endonuclease